MKTNRSSADYVAAIAVSDHPSPDPGSSASPRLSLKASHPSLNWNLTWKPAENINISQKRLGYDNIRTHIPADLRSAWRDRFVRLPQYERRRLPRFA